MKLAAGGSGALQNHK